MCWILKSNFVRYTSRSRSQLRKHNCSICWADSWYKGRLAWTQILNNFFEKGRNSQSYLFQKKRTKKLKKENLNYYTCRISIQGGKNRRIKTQTKYIREQQTERIKEAEMFSHCIINWGLFYEEKKSSICWILMMFIN